MKEITVDSNPSDALLKEIGTAYWPIWQKEVTVFPWEFVTTETALILEGECEMTPEDGSPSITFKAGDLVIFPLGFKGSWEVKKTLKKRYMHSEGDIKKRFFNRLTREINQTKSIMK